jgi:hypothetical protein
MKKLPLHKAVARLDNAIEVAKELKNASVFRDALHLKAKILGFLDRQKLIAKPKPHART